jgi:hypothetical protein
MPGGPCNRWRSVGLSDSTLDHRCRLEAQELLSDPTDPGPYLAYLDCIRKCQKLVEVLASELRCQELNGD